MLTDHHCHILPGIDDGSKNEDMSLEMIRQMHAQGVERIVATPHFYCHREKSVERFLEKRQQAFSKVKSLDIPIKDIRLGAEVAIEHGISEVSGIEKLAIEGTNYILLEFPYISMFSASTAYTPSALLSLTILFCTISSSLLPTGLKYTTVISPSFS